MRDELARLIDRLGDGAVAVVTVLSVDGSTPREVGTRMLVTGEATEGTIGGGALEFQATADARQMLGDRGPWPRRIVDVPLGPAVQQCCGGYVRLLIEVVAPRERAMISAMRDECGFIVRSSTTGAPWRAVTHRKSTDGLPLPVAKAVRAMLSGAAPCEPTAVDVGDTPWLIEPIRQQQTPLYLYGAGHVAREVVTVLDGLPFAISWIDVTPSRFPAHVDQSVHVVVADDLVDVARTAPAGALHVVMTFSHALDEAITAALLEADTFAYLGLIGSKTKRARFVQRFRRMGISEAAIARLTCPIGHPSVPGKMPRAIAISLAAQLVALSAAPELRASVEGRSYRL